MPERDLEGGVTQQRADILDGVRMVIKDERGG